MQRSASMALVATLVIAAGAGVVTPAAAQAAMSDVEYMQAAHCAGLAQGARLDTSKVDALLRANQSGRVVEAIDRGDQMRDDARRQASHAGPFERQAQAAERNGVCSAYLATTGQTAQLGR